MNNRPLYAMYALMLAGFAAVSLTSCVDIGHHDGFTAYMIVFITGCLSVMGAVIFGLLAAIPTEQD